MTIEVDHPPSPFPIDSKVHLIEFLRGRSVLCPICAHDLRDIPTANCPECGEPLVLKVGSPRTRFGWLILAMAPGCFSGVAAVFVLIPIFGMLLEGITARNPVPWPIIGADIFGFLSAISVALMYRSRHRLMALKTRRQIEFTCTVWGTHILALGLVMLSAWIFDY